jgi:hypothetical protein
LGHALHDFKDPKKSNTDHKTFDKQYDDKEERRTIEEIEQPAAKQLGEPLRNNHGGVEIMTTSPTDSKPVYDTRPLTPEEKHNDVG